MKEVDTNVPDEVATKKIDLLFVKYNDYINDTTDRHQTFQQTLAEARANEGNTKVAKEIKQMERIEAQRLSAARIQ